MAWRRGSPRRRRRDTFVLREHFNRRGYRRRPRPRPRPRGAAAASRRPPRRRRRRLGHGYDGRRRRIRPRNAPEAHEIDGHIPRIVGVERARLREVEAQLGDDVRGRAPLVRSFQEERARRRLVQRVDHIARTESGPHKGQRRCLFRVPNGGFMTHVSKALRSGSSRYHRCDTSQNRRRGRRRILRCWFLPR